MSDESTALEGVDADVSEQEAPPEATTETDPEARDAATEDESDRQDDDEREPEPPEEIEFDFGGNKLRVPKGAVPEELAGKIADFTKGAWADYTRKSQAIAEAAKQNEARSSAVEKLHGMTDEALKLFARGVSLGQEIEELSKVDLQSLWHQQPDQARRISDALAQRQAEHQRIVSTLSMKERELDGARQAETARLEAAGRAAVERQIPGFAAREKELVSYVVDNFNIPRGEAERWGLNPAAAVMAWKAKAYDDMQKAAKKAAKPPVQQAAPITPTKKAGHSRVPVDLNRDADKMSADEWMRRRTQQVNQRRAG